MLDGWVACSWGSQHGQVWLVSHLCKSSKRWTTELIKKLLNVAWDMWEHCNSTLHHSSNAQQQIVESLVNNAIREKYAQGPHILSRDAMHFMTSPVEHQLSLPLAAKQQWLKSVELASTRKECHDFGHYLQEQWFM